MKFSLKLFSRPQYIAGMYLNCTYTFVHEDKRRGTNKNPIERRMGSVHGCMGAICSLFEFPSKRVPNEVLNEVAIHLCRTVTRTLRPVCNCRRRQRGRGGRRSRTQRGNGGRRRRFYLDSKVTTSGAAAAKVGRCIWQR